MDCQDYITESVERKKGQHLQGEERGAIQHLKNAGYAIVFPSVPVLVSSVCFSVSLRPHRYNNSGRQNSTRGQNFSFWSR